jgi:glyoxylase-like metal-dependent hydrolase (beta-lactamase superfamily II)
MFTCDCYTGGIAQTNAWLLTLPGGRVLVDAPEGVAEWLEQQNVKPDALVLTHQHFDHCLDAAAVSSQCGCPIFSWSAFSRDLTLERLFGAVSGTQFHVPEFEVQATLEGQTSLNCADRSWTLFHIPGHSPDSVCLYEPDLKLIVGGDVLFAGSVGRTDFPGGSMELLIEGIERDLLPLPDDIRVLPGHGPETTIGLERASNPYLQG